jgi:hypothetical protein
MDSPGKAAEKGAHELQIDYRKVGVAALVLFVMVVPLGIWAASQSDLTSGLVAAGAAALVLTPVLLLVRPGSTGYRWAARAPRRDVGELRK